jgi:hypothetical protein
MDETVYTDPDVQRFASQHVFVKLDAEDGGEGERFAQANGVRGYPTLMVFSSDGRLITQQAGAFRQSSDFLSWIRSNARG